MYYLRNRDCSDADATTAPDGSRPKSHCLQKSKRAFADPQVFEARLWTEFTARSKEANITEARVLQIVRRHISRDA